MFNSLSLLLLLDNYYYCCDEIDYYYYNDTYEVGRDTITDLWLSCNDKGRCTDYVDDDYIYNDGLRFFIWFWFDVLFPIVCSYYYDYDYPIGEFPFLLVNELIDLLGYIEWIVLYVYYLDLHF